MSYTARVQPLALTVEGTGQQRNCYVAFHPISLGADTV